MDPEARVQGYLTAINYMDGEVVKKGHSSLPPSTRCTRPHHRRDTGACGHHDVPAGLACPAGTGDDRAGTSIGAFAALAAMGYTIKTTSLLALVLGIVEGMARHMENGLSSRDAAIKAMPERIYAAIVRRSRLMPG